MDRINITLPKSLLIEINKYCETHSIARSEFIRSLMRSVLSPANSVEKESVEDVQEKKLGGNISEEKLHEIQEQKGIKLCKHGYPFGLCKYGCK